MRRRSLPEPELNALWDRWWAHREPAARDDLVDVYAAFTRMLAAKCYARRITEGLEFADYLQYGIVGLLEAIDRYDPRAGAKFETFAGYRIQGAILNGVEDLSEVQKQVSVRTQIVRTRNASLAGREANESALEVLARTAIGLAIGFALEDVGMYRADDEGAAMPDNAYSRLELLQLKRQLAEAVSSLPRQERLVIERHYFQQVSFTEIAASLGLTKGRVSQLHQKALVLLAKIA